MRRNFARDEQIAGQIRKWKNDAKTAPTAYQRRDSEKAVRAYNRAYSYPLCDRNAAGLGLMQLGDAVYQYLCLLLVLALCCALFSQEHESGMYQVLYAAKRGKAALFRQKICAGMLFAAVLGMLFQTLLFVFLWARRGLPFSLLGAPMQTFPEFALCPFALNLAEYMLLRGFSFALGGVLAVAVIAVISAFFRRTLVIFGASAAICAALLLPGLTAQTSAAGDIMYRAGLLGIMQIEQYLRGYETVNVCGYPVWQIALTLIFTVLFIAVLTLIGRIFYAEVRHAEI